MSITYVNHDATAASSISLPSGWQANDVAIVAAYGSTLPTPAAGWVPFHGATGLRLAYRVLQAGDTGTGTWTNATRIGVIIYRGVDTHLPISGPPSAWADATSGQQYLQPGFTRQKTTDLLVAFASNSGVDSNIFANTPTFGGGETRRFSNTYFGCVDMFGDDNGQASTSSAVSDTNRTVVDFALREPSTFPLVADFDTKSGTVTNNSNSWTLTYPTNIAAGDLLLAFVATDGTGIGNGTWPSGWVSQTDVSGANALMCAKKKATGSEASTFSVTLNASEQGAWVVYRIPAGTWEGTLGTTFLNSTSDDGSVTWASSGAGSGGNPDPPSLDPYNWGTENTLWFALCSVDTSRAITLYPADSQAWSHEGYLASGGSTGATLGWTRGEMAVASEDPGTFSIATSDDWVAATIAVRPAPAKITGSLTADADIVSGGGAQTRSGSFTADADRKKTFSGTFTAEALRRRPSGTLTFSANALLKRIQTGSLSADATQKRTESSAFNADALRLRDSGTISFTADATKSVPRSGSTNADATTKRTQIGSFSADATKKASQSGSFSADATFRVARSGSFSADATLRASRSGGLSSDALKRQIGTGSFSADAVLLKTMSDARAITLLVVGTSFSDDVGVYGTGGANEATAQQFTQVSGSLTRAALILHKYGSPADELTLKIVTTLGGTPLTSKTFTPTGGTNERLTVDVTNISCQLVSSTTYYAQLERTGSRSTSNYWAWDITPTDNYANGKEYHRNNSTWFANVFGYDCGLRLYSDVVGIAADARLRRNSGTLTFSADATLKASQSGSFTCDAFITASQGTVEGSVTADATFVSGLITQTGSYTADGVLRRTSPFLLTEDATLRRSASGTLNASAIAKRTASGVTTANAVLLRVQPGALLGDAAVRRTSSGVVNTEALLRRGGSANLTTDAILRRTQSPSLVADAVVLRAATPTFTADATIAGGHGGVIGAEATLRRAMASSLTAEAVIRTAATGTVSLEAVVRRIAIAASTFDALLARTSPATLTTDATLAASGGGALTAAGVVRRAASTGWLADAVLCRATSASLTADASIRAATTVALTAEASIVLVGQCVWVSPANYTTMAPTPMLVFVVPAAVRAMHFELELDTSPDFDSVARRVYRRRADQTSWEYWDGGWLPIPAAGVPTSAIGQQARLTVTSALDAGTWYRRVRAGVV